MTDFLISTLADLGIARAGIALAGVTVSKSKEYSVAKRIKPTPLQKLVHDVK